MPQRGEQNQPLHTANITSNHTCGFPVLAGLGLAVSEGEGEGEGEAGLGKTDTGGGIRTASPSLDDGTYS